MTQRRFHRRVRVRRGTAAVELAVLLPFLAGVFVIGADWCRIFYVTSTLTDCARTGALEASGLAYQERTLTDAQREAYGKAAALVDGEKLKPSLKSSDVTVTTSGNYVTVTVDYQFNTVTSLLGTAWNVRRSVRMPIHP